MTNILINYLGRKGAGAVFAYEMAKGLLENGADVCAVIPTTIDNLEDWKKLPLKKMYTVQTYSNKKDFIGGFFRFVFREKKKIKKYFSGIKFDAIYIPMLQPWSEFVNKIFPKTKLVTTLHDPIPHKGSSRAMNWLYRRVVKRSDEIIILSEVFKEKTSMLYGISQEHIHVIPHGIFDYYSKYSPEKIDRTSKINFLFFGRISQYKGLHILAKAYKKIHIDYPDTSLFVVGNGDFSEYRDEFRQEDNVTVVNKFVPDEEVVAYFRGNNIVTVLPYIDATQSGIIPIAMKERSLLIVSDRGGLVEQTKGGKLAVLVSPDENDLYEKMKQVILHYDDYSDMLIAASEYIESLSWDKLSGMLLNIIEHR